MTHSEAIKEILSITDELEGCVVSLDQFVIPIRSWARVQSETTAIDRLHTRLDLAIEALCDSLPE
jgi:hypothetical protein